jgi:hypothetical protein
LTHREWEIAKGLARAQGTASHLHGKALDERRARDERHAQDDANEVLLLTHATEALDPNDPGDAKTIAAILRIVARARKERTK